MGDSTKPVSGDKENVIQFPLSQGSGVGRRETVDGQPDAVKQEAKAELEQVKEIIDAGRTDTANDAQGALGQLVQFDDLRAARKKRVQSSHVSPKRLKMNGGKPHLVKAPRRKKPQPRIEGLGLTAVVPTPIVDDISGGKRSKVNKGALDAKRDYAERTGRIRLMQIVGIMNDELSGMENRPLNSPIAGVAARELLALGIEDFALEKRGTDQRFFQEVAKILLRLWPNNWQLHLNDKRVEEMMSIIREGGPHGVILSRLATWVRHRIY